MDSFNVLFIVQIQNSPVSQQTTSKIDSSLASFNVVQTNTQHLYCAVKSQKDTVKCTILLKFNSKSIV